MDPLTAVAMGAVAKSFLGGDEISITVINEIENYVNNTLENMVKIVTESSVKVSTTVLQEQIATIKNDSSSTNIFVLKNVQILDGAKFTMSQMNELNITVSAVFNIIQNNDLVNKIQANIQNDVMATLNQNAELQNDVRNAAYIDAATKTSGEANALLQTLNKGLDMLGATNTSVSQTIKNHIRNELTNITRNTTDISNFVSTIIENNITQRTVNECFKSTNAYNITSLENVVISGKDTTFESAQKNIINSYYSCFVSSTLSTKVLQDISLDILNKSTVITDQGIDVKNEIDNKLKTDASNTTTSWMDNITTIAIVAAICTAVGGIALAIIKMSANKNKKCLKPEDFDKNIPKAISNPTGLPMCKKKGKKGKKSANALADESANTSDVLDAPGEASGEASGDTLNTADIPEGGEPSVSLDGAPEGALEGTQKPNLATAIKYLKHFF
jgi:hypothetical protein